MPNISDYLASRDARVLATAKPRTWDPPVARVIKSIVRSPDMRYKVRVLLTAIVSKAERRKAQRLASGARLHLGSHTQRKEGFINVDLAGIPVDLAWDLRKPLPFPAGAVSAIFHEHVLEHLPLETGLALTQECFRVLAPGGVLRVSVPDAGMALTSYANGAGRPTPLLQLQELFYEHGHRAMYDAETLILLLSEAGFAEVVRRDEGDSRIVPCPDGDRPDSLFVEGVRR